MSLGALFACSEQDQELGIKDQATQSVQFSVNVKDLTTRANVEDPYLDDCPDQEELISAARSNQLEARFKIEGKAQDLEIVRSIKYSDEGKFIADPYDLAQAGSPWELTYFTVWENDGTTEKMLYSAVGSSESEFADFVESDQVLPQSITIGDGDVFNKTTYTVTVICAVNTDAEAFGYKMWNLNFINLQSVSFMVNDCGEDGVHSVLSGKLEVYNDADTTNTVYDEGSVMKTVYFNAGEENKLFLIDHINVNDDKEFYHYKLYKLTTDVNNDGANEGDEGDKYTLRAEGSANVTDLSKFKDSGAWTYSMLDINLCDPEGTEDWIFDVVDDGSEGGTDPGTGEGGSGSEHSIFALEDCDNEGVYVEPFEVEVEHRCEITNSSSAIRLADYYLLKNGENETPITDIIFQDATDNICGDICDYDVNKQYFNIIYSFMVEGERQEIEIEIRLSDILNEWDTFESFLNSEEKIINTCDLGDPKYHY